MGTMGMQIGYYVSWALAGGKMGLDDKKKNYGKVIKKPTKPINFTKKNFVYSEKELLAKVKKFPKGSTIICNGLDNLKENYPSLVFGSKITPFFKKITSYGHFILINVPNFFKLHEELATAWSMFLIDVYHDENFNRGYYSFYSKSQKEKLYFFGKKEIGINEKYSSVKASFKSKFTKWLPFTLD